MELRTTENRVDNDHNFVVWTSDDELIADFCIRRINRAVCWSCKLKIHQPGRGYYKHVHRIKIAHARRLGFVTMLASIASTNEAELRCIDRYGWTRIGEVAGRDNPRLVLAVWDLTKDNQRGES